MSAAIKPLHQNDLIANSFKNAFQRNSQPNNQSKVDELDSQFKTRYQEYSSLHAISCDCSKYQITVHNLLDALYGMKPGKCADDDGLSAEHLHNAPISLLHRITTLFNNMLSHGFVPAQFRLGFMIPLIKDTSASHSDVGNYRGITISPLISKLFEHVLKKLSRNILSLRCINSASKRKSQQITLFTALREPSNITSRMEVACFALF